MKNSTFASPAGKPSGRIGEILAMRIDPGDFDIMGKITKIHIDNRSKWTVSVCMQHVAHLMETETAFIAESRNTGCTFHFCRVNIGILPICKAFPEDTLFFYIHNAE